MNHKSLFPRVLLIFLGDAIRQAKRKSFSGLVIDYDTNTPKAE